MTASPEFKVLDPNLQISFYYRLQDLKDRYLLNALSETVKALDISIIDKELLEYVKKECLTKLASFGLRGEVVFPVPYVLKSNPFLLGYYRLLLGLSQKEFYNQGPFGRFKHMEEKGYITQSAEPYIEALCESLIRSAEILVNGIDYFTRSGINELQLLTLGAQFRGSKNTELGKTATNETFALIRDIVKPYIVSEKERSITIKNDSGRLVVIEFFSDPDIRIIEKLRFSERPLVSVEIKGGTDSSNIYNRLGEAEKSHQKARNNGFHEFWTILRVDIDYKEAKKATPTTSHFFHLDRIRDPEHKEYTEFRDILSSLLSIKIN